MEQVIKHLTYETSALVSKCLSAVEKEDVSQLTKKHFELALEAATLAHQAEHPNLNYHTAYAETLKSELGVKLWEGYSAAELK
jgi:hypothetical protein